MVLNGGNGKENHRFSDSPYEKTENTGYRRALEPNALFFFPSFQFIVFLSSMESVMY